MSVFELVLVVSYYVESCVRMSTIVARVIVYCKTSDVGNCISIASSVTSRVSIIVNKIL